MGDYDAAVLELHVGEETLVAANKGGAEQRGAKLHGGIKALSAPKFNSRSVLSRPAPCYGRQVDWEHFVELGRYADFTSEDAARLRELLQVSEPYLVPIVDDFYRTLAQHPRASSVITGGEAQVERLKLTLQAWLRSLLAGPHDAHYLESHARIGRVHVRIGLPQEFMFSAVSRIRTKLVECAERLEQRRMETISAINKVLDLELAVMLDSYRDDWSARVRASERLSIIGQLAASIGHELRNPLGVAQSSVYLLAQRLKSLELDDPTLAKHQTRIQEQIQICGNAISALLNMARDTPPKKAELQLATVLEHVLSSLPVGGQMRIIRDFPQDLSVFADQDQLEQVLRNLIGNALHFIEESGTVCVSGTSARGGTELRVIDDGPGIPPDNRSRVFDVLFTTRARGTGLGLALCRKIVHYHGGELDLVPDAAFPPSVITSRTGACFRVWFPGASDRPVSSMTGNAGESASINP